MNRLANRSFWDTRHADHAAVAEGGGGVVRPHGRLRGYLNTARMRIGANWGESHTWYLTLRLLRTHLPACEDWKCLEVGCSPGHGLIRVCQMLGYEPFGVEYSPIGAQTARETFDLAGFDANSVFQADFFDERFQNEHAGRYNVVLSRGFIEHFDNVQEVIRSHVDMIAPGGYLVCSIPNLLGWGYPYLVLFEREMLRAHNCGIMRRGVYRRLFEEMELDRRFCDYIGMFQIFAVFERHDKSFRALIARAAARIGSLIDHATLLGLRGRAIKTPWSPNLLYIGQKVT